MLIFYGTGTSCPPPIREQPCRDPGALKVSLSVRDARTGPDAVRTAAERAGTPGPTSGCDHSVAVLGDSSPGQRENKEPVLRTLRSKSDRAEQVRESGSDAEVAVKALGVLVSFPKVTEGVCVSGYLCCPPRDTGRGEEA